MLNGELIKLVVLSMKNKMFVIGQGFVDLLHKFGIDGAGI
jgi:hypothetical protein